MRAKEGMLVAHLLLTLQPAARHPLSLEIRGFFNNICIYFSIRNQHNKRERG